MKNIKGIAMLKLFWIALNSARRALTTIILLLSLAFNVGLVVSETLHSAILGIANAAIGLTATSLRPFDSVASLTAKFKQEQLAKKKVEGELAVSAAQLAGERAAKKKVEGELAVSSAQLAGERVARKKLTQEFSNQGAKLAAERSVIVKAQSTTLQATSKIKERLARMAAREIATAPAKAVPGYGAAVIAATVALEVADICWSMNEMIKLQKIYEPHAASNETDLTFCGAKVPSKEEIYETAISNPSKAIGDAAASMPSEIDELKNIDFQKIDWAFIGNQMKKDADSVINIIANGGTKAISDISGYLGSKSSQIGTWMTE